MVLAVKEAVVVVVYGRGVTVDDEPTFTLPQLVRRIMEDSCVAIRSCGYDRGPGGDMDCGWRCFWKPSWR